MPERLICIRGKREGRKWGGESDVSQARGGGQRAGNAAFRRHAGSGDGLTGNCWNIRRKTIPMIVFTKILIVFPIPILVFRTCWDRDDGMVGDGFAGYDRRFRRIQLAVFRAG